MCINKKIRKKNIYINGTDLRSNKKRTYRYGLTDSFWGERCVAVLCACLYFVLRVFFFRRFWRNWILMSAAEMVAHIVIVDCETKTRGKTRRTRRCRKYRIATRCYRVCKRRKGCWWDVRVVNCRLHCTRLICAI